MTLSCEMNSLKKILIIDEEKFFSENLERILNYSENFELKTSLDIHSAMEILNREKFNFILIDSQILQSFELELNEIINKNNPTVKIIMLDYSTGLLPSIGKLNYAMIEKPFEINDLLTLLN
ncbi:MAG: hypothetical protein Fur0015_00640 [Ignavibacteriales bacterium]